MPDIAEALRQPKPITGGWLYSSLSSLKNKELQIAVATVYKLNELESHYVNGIMYFLLPLHKGINIKDIWRAIGEKFVKSLNQILFISMGQNFLMDFHVSELALI